MLKNIIAAIGIGFMIFSIGDMVLTLGVYILIIAALVLAGGYLCQQRKFLSFCS